ncbi:MAG: hypothetical protein NTW74_19595 [Acidobacteria bacterium]|nr:hypothetical protein [Acidobacteriota bacterium]
MTGFAWAEACPDRGFDFFEKEAYWTRRVELSGFWLLRVAPIEMGDLEGRPFRLEAMKSAQGALRQALIAAPALFDSPVGFSIVIPRVVDCEEKALTIQFRVFTVKAPLGAIGNLEQAREERVNPGDALALRPATKWLRLTPGLGYDASQGLMAGGRLEAGRRVRLGVEGYGSRESLLASSALSMQREASEGWWRQIGLRGGFDYVDRPNGLLRLRSGMAAGLVSLVSAPMGRTGVVARLGSQFEGGHVESVGLAGTRVAHWKTFGGVSMRRKGQALAASYGLQLGRTGSGKLVDYRKQVVDVAYERRWLPAAHRAIEFEAQLQAGHLRELGPTPLAERFYGGNVETQFAAMSGWKIRSNPVMRGVPAFRLGNGVGVKQFGVVNLTLGIPLYGVPIVPREASEDVELREKIDEGLDVALTTFDIGNQLKDPAQLELLRDRKEPFQRVVAAIETRFTELGETGSECADRVGDLVGLTEEIGKNTLWRQFLKDDPEEANIPAIQQLCKEQLKGKLSDLGLELEAQRKAIEEGVNRIDRKKARRLAEQQLAFPREVIRSVMDEMNAFAVSPIVVFDAGRIGVGRDVARYSAGGGLRVTLASSVSFDLGYAWNLRGVPGEGRGALFVALRFVNLFGR